MNFSKTHENQNIMEFLEGFSRRTLPMHMPGHKRNYALAPYIKKLGGDYDLTELSDTDDLYNASGLLKKSMELTSRLYGVRNSFYLVNGTSCGVLSAVFACVNRGERVLVARNSHISVWNALFLRGARVSVLDCEYEKGFCLGIKLSELKKSLESSAYKLLIITSPSYEGVISDVAAISKLCKKQGVKLMVDAAHGAHFGLFSYHEHAVGLGADIEIKSLHKTLPSLGSTALLQSNDDELFERAKSYIRMFQTSSPSYVLMSSIDECMHLIEKRGEYLFKRFSGMLDFSEACFKRFRNIELFKPSKAGFSKDKSRLCFYSCKNGEKLDEMLKKSGIYMEMSSENHCLALTGLTESKKALCALIDGLIRADRLIERKGEQGPCSYLEYPKLHEVDYSLFSCETEIVSLDKAKGRVLAENVYAYPPGIAYLIAGQRLEGEVYYSLLNNDKLHYLLTEKNKNVVNVSKM